MLDAGCLYRTGIYLVDKKKNDEHFSINDDIVILKDSRTRIK